jgi:drug/metabolite transporter (DMT)-like permease
VPVLVGVASGDRPAALQLAGILAASVGVVLASRERGPGLAPTEDARASVVLALLAALSVVAVAASLYPLTSVVLARLVLGERVRRIQEVGIAAALAGVVLIAVG